MGDFLHRSLLCFIPIFVALDAIGNVPLFMGLTEGLQPRERTRAANLCVAVATAIAMGFMLGGNLVFSLLGIEVCDFRIAGGILLLVLSANMLIVGKPVRPDGDKVPIFPMASPLIAGPALLTITLVLAGTQGFVPTFLSLAVNMAIAWVVFRNAHRIERLITKQGSKAFSKVVEILLATIAVMLIRSGIEAAVARYIADVMPPAN